MFDFIDWFNEYDVREFVGLRVSEIFFSFECKYMGVIVGLDSYEEKEYVYMKGLIERVLEVCDIYIDGDGWEMILDFNGKKEVM